jgi:hypothetical protein
VVFEILFIVGFPDNGTWQQACTLTHNPESNQCDSGQVRLLKPTIINKFPHLLKSLTPHLLYAVTSYFYDYKWPNHWTFYICYNYYCHYNQLV